jgi:hypothetical protein
MTPQMTPILQLTQDRNFHQRTQGIGRYVDRAFPGWSDVAAVEQQHPRRDRPIASDNEATTVLLLSPRGGGATASGGAAGGPPKQPRHEHDCLRREPAAPQPPPSPALRLPLVCRTEPSLPCLTREGAPTPSPLVVRQRGLRSCRGGRRPARLKSLCVGCDRRSALGESVLAPRKPALRGENRGRCGSVREPVVVSIAHHPSAYLDGGGARRMIVAGSV